MKNKIKNHFKMIQEDFFKNYNYKLHYFKSNHNTLDHDTNKKIREELDQLKKIKNEIFIQNDYINIPHVYSKASFYNKVNLVMELVKEGTPFEEAVNH